MMMAKFQQPLISSTVEEGLLAVCPCVLGALGHCEGHQHQHQHQYQETTRSPPINASQNCQKHPQNPSGHLSSSPTYRCARRLMCFKPSFPRAYHQSSRCGSARTERSCCGRDLRGARWVSYHILVSGFSPRQINVLNRAPVGDREGGGR